MVKKYSGRGLKTITISGPGLRPQKFKICVGDHPDDIKKWIDERKRRFPRRDGSHRTVGDASLSLATSGCKRNRNDETESNVAKQSCVGDRELIESATTTSSNKLDENSGLSSLLEGYDSSSSDDGNVESKSKTTTADVGPPMEDTIAKSSTLAVESSQSQPKRICKYHQRGNCRHGDSCKFLHSNDVDEYSPNQRQKQKISSQSDRDKARNRYEEELKMLGLVAPGHGSRYSGGEKVISSTSLLHKLLQRDKERERRLTLQLLRYIVDCDYFRDGDKSEPVCDGVSETT